MKTKFQEIYEIVEKNESEKGFYISDFKFSENKVAFRICDKITDIFVYAVIAKL
jgi:hypothetical protein